jgi:hypothetical protein
MDFSILIVSAFCIVYFITCLFKNHLIFQQKQMSNFILCQTKERRECVKLIFQGYIYIKHGTGKEGAKGQFYWRCTQSHYKCRGRTTTDIDFNATLTRKHNHEPLPSEEEEMLVKKHFIAQEEVKIRFDHHQSTKRREQNKPIEVIDKEEVETFLGQRKTTKRREQNKNKPIEVIDKEEVETRLEQCKTTKRREPKSITNVDIDHIIQRLIFDSDEGGKEEKSKPIKVIDNEEVETPRLEQRKTTKHLLSAGIGALSFHYLLLLA